MQGHAAGEVQHDQKQQGGYDDHRDDQAAPAAGSGLRLVVLVRIRLHAAATPGRPTCWARRRPLVGSTARRLAPYARFKAVAGASDRALSRDRWQAEVVMRLMLEATAASSLTRTNAYVRIVLTATAREQPHRARQGGGNAAGSTWPAWRSSSSTG